MAVTTRLATIGEEYVPDHAAPNIMPEPAAPSQPSRAESMMASLLMMTLRTLPAKTAIALAGLADLAMIASAFVLWMLVIANPTPLQLMGIGGYAAFVLVALLVRRRS